MILSILFIFIANFVLPTVGNPSETTVILSPVADSWVYANFANMNYGNSNSLQAENFSSPETRQIYIKFNLSTIPPSGTLTSATLHMYATSLSWQTNRILGTYFVSNDSWTESGIIWNNKPVIGSIINSTSVSFSAWAIWNVLSQVQSEYNGDKIISIALTFPQQNLENQKVFYSKEYTNSSLRPYLEITYTNISETHSVCNYTTRTCEIVNGTGTNQCANFNDCIHKACIGESCEDVDSPGVDECTDNDECINPVHSECQNGTCVAVQGAGQSECSEGPDCYHSECDYGLKQCIQVNTPGANSCESSEDCELCLPDIIVDKKVNPSTIFNCQKTTVTLNVTGVGCPQTSHLPIDLMLVFDRTGSMDDDCPGGVEANTSPCKIHEAKVAAKFFIGLLNPSLDRSGLVSFNNTATLNQVLTYNQTTVQSAIDTLKALGQTAIGSGINTANNELTSHGRNGTARVEILLSDGNENLGSNPINRANEAKAAGIVIYTIGLGASVDASLLQQIASITGGKYYFAANGTVLQQIYQSISQEIFLNIGGKNVVVKDVIPSYANYAGGLTSNPPDNCSYNVGTKTITCNLVNVSINQSYLITFDENFSQTGNILSNVYPDSNVTFTDFNNTQRTKVFPQTFVNVTSCFDGNECTQDVCDAQSGCHYPPESQGTQCGSPRDCQSNACNGVKAEFYPDDGHDTCDGSGNCLEYSCSLIDTYCTDNNPFDGFNTLECGAGCDQNSDCQNYCDGDIRNYGGSCNLLSTCSCSYDTENCDLDDCYVYQTGCEDRDYFCQPGACNYTFSNRNTDFNDSFVNYCSADTIRKNKTSHDFYCNGVCSDHTGFADDQLVQDCSLQNGWNDTGQTRWISETYCTEREQKEQKYRNYTCSNAQCTYTNTSTQWINTSQTRNKPNGTVCDDGLYCTVSDVCTLGACGGSPRDCSDGNECTQDICNETLYQCQHPNLPDGTDCTGDPGECCSGLCDNNGVSGSGFDDECRSGPTCIAPGDWGYSTANQGSGCDAFIDYCNDPSTCDSRQHKKSCDVGYCNGGWVSDQDTTGDACQPQDCGTCCICGSNDNRTYDNIQNSDCSDTICIDNCNIDTNPFTWDYADDVPNYCQALDTCTQNQCQYQHECHDNDPNDGIDGNTCGAECDQNTDCQNYCLGNIRYYSGSCNLTSCGCTYSTENCDLQDNCYSYDTGCEDRDYFCQAAGCNYTFSNQNTDYNDSFVNYCSADTIRKNKTSHDFYCNGLCSDHTSWVDDNLVENCNLQDGWYNTTNTQWIDTDQCNEKEQLEQEYRDYTCSDAACTYTIDTTKGDNGYQWVDTGQTRNKQDGTLCGNAPLGACDVQDTCQSGVCVDNLISNGIECRPSAGDCDVAEQCTGSNPDCPTDGYLSGAVECRASAGICDVADFCTGSDASCPTDVKSTSLCRASVGDCDVAESCDGINNDCPNDVFEPDGTFCDGTPSLICDAQDTCLQGTCVDNVQPIDTSCRLALDQCDVEEFCDGVNKVCPTNLFQPLSTPCDDSQFCSETDHCDGSGLCVPLSQRTCDDSVACTSDSCNETDDQCVHAPQNSLCDDGLFCNGFETCNAQTGCLDGTAVNCSDNNISSIATCFNIPDENGFTWDSRNPFTSVCVEDTNNQGHCNTGDETITHTCSVIDCNAECDATHSCDNKCVDSVRYYSGSCNLTSCGCTYSTENCDLQDGWYNTTNTKWVDMCDCTEREQVKQEYRDYTCVATPGVACNYTVTNTTWIYTGNTRSKPDISGPTTYNLNAKIVCVRLDCNLLNIKATVKDACSNLAGYEYFFDTCPSSSIRGTSMLASDGTFDEKIEDVFKNSVNLSAMTEGRHTLYARGKDDKGNWGPCSSKICYNWKESKFCL